VLASSFCRSIEANSGNHDQGCLPDHLCPSLRRSHVLQARRNESVHGCRSRVRAWLRGTRRVRSCSQKKSRSSGKIAQESHAPQRRTACLRNLEVVDGACVPRSERCGLKRCFATEQRLRVHTLSNQCLAVTSNSPVNDHHKNVLHVSPDRTLARSRHQVLSAVGFRVFCVYTVSAALFEISLGRCGTLLLCHQLKKNSRETLATFFHERCPEPFIVAIVADENDYCPPQSHARVVHSSDHVALLRVFREKLAA
jgi:hypothetical protein